MIKLVVALACVTAAFAAPAWAFDTAPHATITEQAMALAGYNRAAADAAQVENWLTDYYTSSPTWTGNKCELEKLHFDDVFTDADVDAYWKTLLRNTRGAVAKAKADGDYLALYTVIGVSLHVVQDFYAHSNWVESSGFAGPGFDTTTYFQWAQNPWKRTDVVHTGWYPNCLDIPQDGHQPHGGYTGPGMNHDSVVRANYNRAYVYALAASVEWLEQIRQAVAAAPGDPAFGRQMLNYSPMQPDAAALARDQLASLYISEWIENPINPASLDGHWNGNRSGYAGAFAAFVAAWTGTPDSIYVRAFKQKGVPTALSQGLYAPFVGADPPIAPVALTGTVVDMRTPRVDANYAVGSESYFGQIVATNGGGQGHPAGQPGFPIRDASQYHLPRTQTPWEYITLVPSWSDSFDMRYSFWDEYGIPPGQRSVPINGDSTELKFACALTGGPPRCVWGDPGGQMQTMPALLTVNGGGFRGVKLSGISIQLSPGRPARP